MKKSATNTHTQKGILKMLLTYETAQQGINAHAERGEKTGLLSHKSNCICYRQSVACVARDEPVT